MGQRRKALRIFQHERVRRAGIEPDIENIVDLLPVFVGELAEETLARAGRVPGVGAFRLEGVDDGGTDIGIVEDLDRAVLLVLDEQGDRHAPGALAGNHPVRPGFDHAGDAVFALRRHPARLLDRFKRKLPQRAPPFALPLNNAIGWSMAMNHCGVLRKITGFFDRHECGY